MNDLILGPQVPIGDNYFDKTFIQKALQHGLACPSTPPSDPEAVTIQGTTFNNHFYYDLPLVLYIAYRRTGDAQFLALARNAADVWWQHPQWIGSGRIRLFPDSATPAPRHAGLGGLMCRALDGRPEMWDWINAYTRAAFDTWIKTRLMQPQLHYGLREGAFVLQAAAWLVKVLPDAFPNAAAIRAQYLADIESACVNYFGRLQFPDGSWRWNTSPDEPRDSDGGTWVGIMQPFMVGLTTSALIDAYEVVQSLTVRESIKSQVLKACHHLYSDGPYIKDEVEVRSGKRIRGFHYFYHGGTSVNPTKYVKGDIKFPWTDVEGWWLASARQPISTILPAYGWAYKVSGDEFFKLAGEELWDSAYSGRDGFRAMLDDTAKNFNQHARRGGSYRAWLGSGVVEPPLPTPAPAPPQPEPTPESPLPTPPPVPVFIPSPDPTKGVEVIDNTNGRWTLGTEKQTLRNGLHVGSGAGFTYKWTGGTVYVLGMDGKTWYKWNDKWVEVGQQEPGGTVVAPTPQPVPTPTLTPTPPTAPEVRKVPWPTTEAKQDVVIATQWKDRFRFKRHLSGAFVEFEKVS